MNREHFLTITPAQNFLARNKRFLYDGVVRLTLKKTTIRVQKIFLLVILLAMMISLPAGALACSYGTPAPLKIGILLPLTGPDSVESQEVLDWAVKGLNSMGGIRGVPVEIIYRDTHNQDIVVLAREFTDDPSIQIVIGPQKSSDLHILAPLFIESRKLLISPMATAGNILRAYGKTDFIWRTCQSDVAQVRSILYELSTRNVTRISLIYAEDDYGQTFLEWTGFFCTELGIDLLNTVGYNRSSEAEAIMDEALAGEPEYILAAAYASEAVKFKKLLDLKETEAKLFFTDAAETPFVIENLGAASLGIELLSPAADPGSGFEAGYFAEYGYYPWDYAASTHDAFLLAACTLARQESLRGLRHLFERETIEESFKKVISGTGTKTKWNECSQAVNLILQGELPDVDGASGPLRFDKESGVDPAESFYSLNRIETREGVIDFRTVRRFSSSESEGVGLLDENTSAVSTRASHKYSELNQTGAAFQAGEREYLQAVIISTSGGWNNYRHQSDALAVYNLLKKNGVADKDIILFSIDDVPWLEENPLQGDIHHEVKGLNIRDKAVIDYSGETVTLANLRNVLLGKQTEKTPEILESNERSNVLIYLVGHGMPRAVNFEYGDQLTSRGLAQLVNEMYSMKKYRQMLIIAEACYGESLSMDLNAPGVAFLTGASRIESSFGATYDKDIRQWLADDFTLHVLKAIAQPSITLEDLYLTVYSRVTGSHVRLVNYANFGDLKTPVHDFLMPLSK